MEQPEKPMSEKESLDLITMMINKAKDSYYDTGVGAMMWGIVIVVCSLVRLAELQFHFRLPFDIYWLTFIAVIPQIIISMREKKMRKVKSYDDIYLDYVWTGFGICIFLLIVIINVVGNAIGTENGEIAAIGSHGNFKFYEYIASMFLLLYGLPTFITGAACKMKAMFWGGILCWVCCVIALFTPFKIDLLLIAFAALVAWLIPGILMQRGYRKAKKELAQQDV